MRHVIALALALLVCAAAAGSAWTAPPRAPGVAGLADLDDFMAQALAEWKVPGAAVAVVRDGQVIYARGFGVRDVDGKKPVTPDTVFAIGSCTKAFTSAALCLLADQGALSLDAPVRDILPAFRLADDYATAHVTVRDMLLHRTGLPRYDALITLRPELSREQIVAALRYLPANKELRAGFEYSNLMYVAAGRLVEVVSGQSFEDFVTGRFFVPLGMTATGFRPPAGTPDVDAAAPHAQRRGRLTRIPEPDLGAYAPAGSIRASASDMARWLLFQLGDGRAGQTPLLSRAAMTDMHTPQIITPQGQPSPEIPFGGYGLGWGVTAYRGRLLVLHAGEIDGFKALASIMPDDHLGVVVLTNRAGTPLPEIAAFTIYDGLLGLSSFPWAERARADRARAANAAPEAPATRPPAPPSHALSAYAGTYRHPAFGEVVVSGREDALAVVMAGQTIPLAHVAYDAFRLEPADGDDPGPEPLDVTFHMDPSGDIVRLDIPLDPDAPSIVFTKTDPGPVRPDPSGPAAPSGDAPQGATRP